VGILTATISRDSDKNYVTDYDTALEIPEHHFSKFYWSSKIAGQSRFKGRGWEIRLWPSLRSLIAHKCNNMEHCDEKNLRGKSTVIN
jgi:hypothetical protein